MDGLAKLWVFIQSWTVLVAALPQGCSQLQIFHRDKLAKSRDKMEHHLTILAIYVADWIPGINLLQRVHKDVVCPTSSSLKCTILLICLFFFFHSWVQPSLHTTLVIVTYFVEATDQSLCLLNHSSFHSPLNHSLDVLLFVLFCHCCICPSRFQLSLCHLGNKDE